MYIWNEMSLFSFRFTCMNICSFFHSMSWWSLSLLPYSTTFSSAMPNTFGTSLNISSNFHWSISPVGAAPNAIFYICTFQGGMQMLWGMIISHLASGCDIQNSTSIRERYFTFVFSFGKISSSVGPIWTSLISAWYSLAGYRHRLTSPLGLIHIKCVISLQFWEMGKFY